MATTAITSTASKQAFVPSSSNEAFAQTYVLQLDALFERCKVWESTDYKRANEGLYSLLADCLNVFNTQFVKGTESDKRTLRLNLEKRLKASGIRVQRNSTTLTMLVRYVFNSDRKRAQGYAYVLKSAISHSKTAEELPGWIASEGGIEQIKLSMVQSEKAKANQAKLVVAKTQVATAIQKAELTPLAQVHLAGLTGNYALLLAKPLPNGMVAIVGALADLEEPLYNAMLLKMAKRKSAENEQSETLSKETDDLLSNAESANDSLLQKAA
jgi:hypothetical protein